MINLCEKLQVKTNIVSLDPIKFFESGDFYTYGEKYGCQSPQICTHLWLLDQIDGTPVLSGNFIYPVKNDNEYFWYGLPGDLHATYFRYLVKNHRCGEPWFILNRSQLAASLVRNVPSMDITRNHKKLSTEREYKLRIEAYRTAGFTIEPQKQKTTGFEKLRLYYDKRLNTKNGVGFDALFRNPLIDLNPYPDEYIQIVPSSFLEHEGKEKNQRGFVNKLFNRFN
jgi:hypothetical protein